MPYASTNVTYFLFQIKLQALNGWVKLYVPTPSFGEINNAISNDLVWQVKGDHEYQNYQGKVDILEKNTTSGIYNLFQRLEGIGGSTYFGYSLAMTPDAMILVVSASGTHMIVVAKVDRLISFPGIIRLMSFWRNNDCISRKRRVAKGILLV